ncbi:MAG TPA: lysophospholipid acyltransferase family protein [Methylomirabilota bacterium]
MLTALAPPVAAAAVRALGVTLRLTEAGVETMAPLWAARQPLIYAVWHGRLLMIPWLNARLCRTRGARAARVLASRSRDGELVARWVARFGLPVVRGSSSRGGAQALRALAAAVRAGEDVAVVPDGPRGPRERLQAGLVVLGAATGAPIVPLGFAARPARRLASWDRLLIPWPFARAALVFGKAVTLARDADREAARADLERALREVTETADRLVGA